MITFFSLFCIQSPFAAQPPLSPSIAFYEVLTVQSGSTVYTECVRLHCFNSLRPTRISLCWSAYLSICVKAEEEKKEQIVRGGIEHVFIWTQSGLPSPQGWVLFLLLAAAVQCVLLNQCESLSRIGKYFFFFFSLYQWNKIFPINILPSTHYSNHN